MSSMAPSNSTAIHQKLRCRFYKLFVLSALLLYIIIYIVTSNHPCCQSSTLFTDPCSPTNITHLVFGISASSNTWNDKKHYVESWWRPNITCGYLFLDRPPTEHLPWPSAVDPPFKVSEGHDNGIRMARAVVEAFRAEKRGVRWYVMAEDDTVFFVNNLVEVLGKYDHRKYYYVGMNSECIVANWEGGFGMGFGGGGYALSYPLVEALAENLDLCAIPISDQTAITKDNVPITIDGVLYIKIIDPILASYGVEDPINAVVQLAQTTMRSELGKITMDKTFEERDALNKCILDSINDRPLRTDWGLECLRYEIKDVNPPEGVKEAMELQAEAERKKRAKILTSEGQRQDDINIADGKKNAVILGSEALKIAQENVGKGEAEAIFMNAQATAKGIQEVSKAIEESGGVEATSLSIAEQYIEAFDKILKQSTTVLVPGTAADIAGVVAQAATIYNKVSETKRF